MQFEYLYEIIPRLIDVLTEWTISNAACHKGTINTFFIVKNYETDFAKTFQAKKH